MKNFRILIIVLAIAILGVLTSQVAYQVKAKSVSTLSVSNDKNPDGDRTKKSDCCTKDNKDNSKNSKEENCCKDKNKESCCKDESKNTTTTTTHKPDGCCKPKDLRE